MKKRTKPLGLKQRLKSSTAEEREALRDGLHYEIGFAKPPLSNRFKQGQSGNPKGRPKKTTDFGKILEDEFNAKVEVKEGGRKRRLSKGQIALRQLANKAAAGDLKAFQTAVDMLRKTGRLQDSPAAPSPTITESDSDAAAELLGFLKAQQNDSDDHQPS